MEDVDRAESVVTDRLTVRARGDAAVQIVPVSTHNDHRIGTELLIETEASTYWHSRPAAAPLSGTSTFTLSVWRQPCPREIPLPLRTTAVGREREAHQQQLIRVISTLLL